MLTMLPQTPSQMVSGHPSHVSSLSTPSASRSPRIRNEVVIGPRGNGFPGPAVALDGPEWTIPPVRCNGPVFISNRPLLTG